MSNVIKYEEQKKELDFLKNLAATAIKSGNYANMSEMTALNIMLSAKDLGVSPMKALNGGFYVVNGKISMSTALMTDRIRKEGHSIKIPEWNKEKCVIIGVRKDNGDSVKVEFTMEDAQLAGLTNSPTWKKYPKVMLYNRAMSMIARILFPDVVGNAYSEDEAEEIKGSSYTQKEALIEVQEAPKKSIQELKELLTTQLDIAQPQHLENYLEYCHNKTGKPLEELVNAWLVNSEPFLRHYSGWVAKKNAETIVSKKEDDDLSSSLQMVLV